MTDIVERLRSGEDGLEYAAADEIERLCEALREILQAERWNEESFRKGCDIERAITLELMSDTVRIARVALKETGHE